MVFLYDRKVSIPQKAIITPPTATKAIEGRLEEFPDFFFPSVNEVVTVGESEATIFTPKIAVGTVLLLIPVILSCVGCNTVVDDDVFCKGLCVMVNVAVGIFIGVGDLTGIVVAVGTDVGKTVGVGVGVDVGAGEDVLFEEPFVGVLKTTQLSPPSLTRPNELFGPGPVL